MQFGTQKHPKHPDSPSGFFLLRPKCLTMSAEAPASERGRSLTWRKFIGSHLEVLAAVDFFTAEVWIAAGLTAYYVLSCLRVAIRAV